MISIRHRSRNPYALYGIHHFTGKYGIPVKLNGASSSGVCIEYGARSEGIYRINVAENEIQPRITGVVRTGGGDLPVFEIPKNTGDDGIVEGIFSSGGGEFPCITGTDEGTRIGIDVFKETGYALSGNMETFWKETDSEGRPVARLPLVDMLQDLLFRSILTGCGRVQVPLVTRSFWPEGKQFAVCLTHDVDEVKKTYQWFTYPLKLLLRGNFRGLRLQFLSLLGKIKGREPYWTFEDLISLEKELSVSSTYFFLKETARVKLLEKHTWKHHGRRYRWDDPAIREIMEVIQAEGSEIGLHGSYESYNSPSLLKREKDDLERVLQHGIQGTRQHNLRLIIPDTWRYQEMAGLLYDSTLGFHDDLGFRWGTCCPFYPLDSRSGVPSQILEIPLAIQDTVFFRQGHPLETCYEIAKNTRACHGVLTLLWHHAVFNRYEFPEATSSYRNLIEFCKERNAWVTNGAEINRWWRSRQRLHFGTATGTNMLQINIFPEDQNAPKREERKYLTVYMPYGYTVGTISGGEVIGTKEQEIYLRTMTGREEPTRVEFSGAADGS